MHYLNHAENGIAFSSLTGIAGGFINYNKDKPSHLPEVTKRLIHDSFLADVKTPELACKAARAGERFARELKRFRGEGIARY